MNNSLTQRLEARAFSIPAGAQKITCKVSGAVAYLYTNDGEPCAMGFTKSAMRPTFRFRFQDARRREVYVTAFLARHAGVAQIRAKAAAERAAFVHNLKVGEILYSTWGYEQTNCDFYQVTAVRGKVVIIRKIGAARFASNDATMTGSVVAMKDAFCGEPMRKRVGEGNNVSLTSYSSASRWDGEPVAISWYG